MCHAVKGLWNKCFKKKPSWDGVFTPPSLVTLAVRLRWDVSVVPEWRQIAFKMPTGVFNWVWPLTIWQRTTLTSGTFFRVKFPVLSTSGKMQRKRVLLKNANFFWKSKFRCQGCTSKKVWVLVQLTWFALRSGRAFNFLLKSNLFE